MFEPDKTPVKKLSNEPTAHNLLKEALRGSENIINYHICEELNRFENKTGFNVKHVIVTITDGFDDGFGSDDKEVSVKIILDVDSFV